MLCFSYLVLQIPAQLAAPAVRGRALLAAVAGRVPQVVHPARQHSLGERQRQGVHIGQQLIARHEGPALHAGVTAEGQLLLRAAQAHVDASTLRPKLGGEGAVVVQIPVVVDPEGDGNGRAGG